MTKPPNPIAHLAHTTGPRFWRPDTRRARLADWLWPRRYLHALLGWLPWLASDNADDADDALSLLLWVAVGAVVIALALPRMSPESPARGNLTRLGGHLAHSTGERP